MKKTIAQALSLIIPLIFLIVILASCNNGENEAGNTSIILSQNNISFTELGETAELTTLIIKDGIKQNGSEIVWSSTDPGIAIVEDGVITAVGYGSCVVRATVDGSSSFCTVKILNPNPPLAISHSELALDNIGDSYGITAVSDTGEDISSRAVWRSSNTNIAVCDDGIITAVGYGSCTVSATYNSKTALCIVTVRNPIAPDVQLSVNELVLSAGQTHTLSAKINNGAGGSISWKSSDESIATCVDGVITANKNGTCAIIAMTDLGYTDLCVVSVGSEIKRTEVVPYLNFGLPHIGKELLCIDKITGQINTSVTVIGYNMKTLLLSDKRLIVELSLVCVKTYDKNGVDGTAPSSITTTLYRENDVFCDKKIHVSESVRVGEVFTIKYPGFSVQTQGEGTVRELYMTFSSITEK